MNPPVTDFLIINLAVARACMEAVLGWAVILGVQEYCPWHERDLPSCAQNYV